MRWRPPRRRFAPLLVLAAATAAAPCDAQVQAGLDAAASFVRYEGYLGSAAVNVTPSVAWRSLRSTVTARGTLLIFESGHQSFQGVVTAGSFSPALGPVRLEASAEAGASSFSGFAWFAHGLGHLRLHVLSGSWGLWAGPLGGMVSRQGSGYAAAGFALGGWARSATAGLEIAWTGVTVGDTTYGDLAARARWRYRGLETQGTLGSRFSSLGARGGGYGDVTGALQVSPTLALVVSAGRYPSDPVSGSIAGSYVTAGFRIASRTARFAAPPTTQLAVPPGPAPAAGSPAAARPSAALERQRGLSTLVVRVAGAQLVEVMGDFTGWQAVALVAAGGGRWRFPATLPPGMYRFDLRVDGGPWLAPEGLATAPDEFGGTVGVVVVP